MREQALGADLVLKRQRNATSCGKIYRKISDGCA
jgi:hypothetical protein